MKKRKHTSALVTLALIIFANPNFNLFDIFPDIFGCIIAICLIGKYADIVPYAEEAKSSFKKLAAVNLVKLPAAVIMMSNISSGTDAAALFSLVFCILEFLFLYPAISNTFSALYYLGERSEKANTIQPFTVFEGKSSRASVKMSTDTLKLISYVFVSVKSALFFLPDICLLTYSEDTLTALLRSLYPLLTVLSLLSVLLFGAAWLFLCLRYAKAIRTKGSLSEAALELASTDKLEEIEKERTVKEKLSALSILAVSSLFIFDFSFSDVLNGVSIIPHAFYYLILAFVTLRLFDRSLMKFISVGAFSVGAVLSAIAQFFTYNFYSEYELRDILDLKEAAEKYDNVIFVSLLEGIAAVAALGILCYLFVKFTKSNAGFSPDEAYNKTEAKKRQEILSRKGILLFAYSSLIVSLRCLDVYLSGNVQLIWSDVTDVTKPVIAASPLPWLSTAVTLLAVGFVFYSLYFLSSVKDEIKMKFSTK